MYFQLTIPNHGLTVSNTVTITDDSLFFRCSDDNFFTEQPYPRSTDPASGSTVINSVTSSTITVNVGPGGGAGTGATVEATVVGGTLAFNITNPEVGMLILLFKFQNQLMKICLLWVYQD